MTDSKSRQDQLNDVTAFVEEEAGRAANGVRNQLIVLAVVALILVGYFAWLNSQLRTLTEPENVAKQSVIFIDDNVSEFANGIESMIRDAVPEIADFMRDKVINEGVPYLVNRSEDMLDGYIQTLSQTTADYLDQAFTEVVKDNKDAILASAKEGVRGPDWPANALKPLREKLHAQFKDQTTGKPTEALDSIHKSLIALRNLNMRLQKLAKKDPEDRSRKEQLGARLLNVYWNYTNTRGPADVESKQIPGQGKYAGEGNLDPQNAE